MPSRALFCPRAGVWPPLIYWIASLTACFLSPTLPLHFQMYQLSTESADPLLHMLNLPVRAFLQMTSYITQ